MDELTFIEWMRRNGAGDLGDDCAVIDCEAARAPMVVTADMLLDGTHFSLAEHGPQAVGYKAIACSLSDIAAMGCRPAAAFCCGALPRDISAETVREIFTGARGLCEKFHVAIAGGDTTAWRRGGRLVLSVTMIGWADGCLPIRRSGAKAGDAIFVTGRLGGSILGRHLSFTPRVAEGRYLAERGDVHAMIDVSDGLAADLAHIAEESRCGACIEAAAVPVAEAAVELAKSSRKAPLEHALHDGEDFELLFTTAPAADADLLADWPFETKLSRIGRIEAGGLAMIGADGSRRQLAPAGYVHKFGEDA